jgi:hypothetical protein
LPFVSLVPFLVSLLLCSVIVGLWLKLRRYRSGFRELLQEREQALLLFKSFPSGSLLSAIEATQDALQQELPEVAITSPLTVYERDLKRAFLDGFLAGETKHLHHHSAADSFTQWKAMLTQKRSDQRK